MWKEEKGWMADGKKMNTFDDAALNKKKLSATETKNITKQK